MSKEEQNKIEVKIETIDPQKAAQYLALNRKNRRIFRNHLDGLVHDMKNGKWIFNGDPIRFNGDGYMIDGQHRMQAMIESGATLDLVVIRELSERAFETVDIGRKRSMPDFLSIEGKAHPQQLASALSYITRYHKWQNIMSHEKITVAEKLTTLAEHPQIERLVAAYASRNYPLKASVGILAACHYLFHEINQEQADIYMGQVVMGEDLSEGDPAFTVRRWIIRAHTGKTNARIGETVGNVIFRGWNAFRDGEQLYHIKTVKIPIRIK